MTQYSRRLYSEKWWRQLRWFVINERAGGMCEIRKSGCYGVATEVHHVCYPVGRREQASDLLAACDWCHYLMHYPAPANDNDEDELPLVSSGN